MFEATDSFGRKINYLRLSITDRCNLRCHYCMPEQGIVRRDRQDILAYEDFLHIVSAAARIGVRKVRITGGEPLVRKGVLSFFDRLSRLDLIDEIALTTNGILLAEYANDLKTAGIRSLNVSLDSLIPETFDFVTRGGALSRVLAGLDKAEAAGLKIKLNMVVMKGVNDREILDFARLSLERPWTVRFIEYMPTVKEAVWRQRLVSGAEVLDRIRQYYPLEKLTRNADCGPARPYRIKGARGTLGIITPMSDHFCDSCNRIRITAYGLLKSCLFSDDVFDLKPSLSKSAEELSQVLLQVIKAKPRGHLFTDDYLHASDFSMASIGG